HCTIIRYCIGRAIGPANKIAWQKFQKLYAIIVATPGLYQELITQYNTHTSNKEAFKPQTFHRHSAANMTEHDVAHTMICNGIPTTWVDHSYHFGLWWFNHSYQGDPIHQSLYDEANDWHLRYLAKNGEPPAIQAWDGWQEPTNDNLNQFYYFDQKYTHQETTIHQCQCSWLVASISPSFQFLESQQYSIDMDTRTHTTDPLSSGLPESGPSPPTAQLDINSLMDEANASIHHWGDVPKDRMDVSPTETNISVPSTYGLAPVNEPQSMNNITLNNGVTPQNPIDATPNT
ncbi:hypothetical protein P691DRAFT_676579, partial [Macrolepiota fuliginosa MF-IS2]